VSALATARVLPEGVSELAAARARRAWLATERGTASAADCTSMALDALRDGTLLDAALESTAYHRCVGVLIMTDAIDEARDAIAALQYRASTAAEWFESELALRAGELTAAERHAREALDGTGEAGPAFFGAFRVLACALAERGAFDEAREVLRCLPPGSSALLRARARVTLAEGRFEQAYADAREIGARNARQGRVNPTWDGWRSTAALAVAHLGRRREAAALAGTELAEANAFGAPVAIARARHARTVAEPDDHARVTLSEHALNQLGHRPPKLEAIRLRLELGSALARTGRRVEAREPLRHALADADRAGAILLAHHARRELVATGLRPRRAAIDGPGALTPRQRQICELAAAGKGNRAIAGELFLSLKTVETHLAAAYRKLGVRGRADLAGSLVTT
jgi:DNA-binding CsgD family transcriptional regulator